MSDICQRTHLGSFFLTRRVIISKLFDTIRDVLYVSEKSISIRDLITLLIFIQRILNFNCIYRNNSKVWLSNAFSYPVNDISIAEKKNKLNIDLFFLVTVFDGIWDAPQFQQGKSRKKRSTYIKRDGINIINIINDNTFNLHNSLLNNDNRYIKVTLKSKLIGVIM